MERIAPKKVASVSMDDEQKEKDRMPILNDEIQGHEKKYKLKKVLGEGGYGIVFLSQDGERLVAVKTEKYSKSMLHVEVGVLKAANAAKAKHFCELMDYGSIKPDYVYMVMTLLHEDLHKLRHEMPDKRFTLSTSLRVSMQTLKAIEELHKLGYISRDIKPGNFAPGHRCNNQSRTIFLYDFGLSKKYVDKDLGRRDDMESWFYMIVEMTKGTLPWRFVSDRNAVGAAKQAARGSDRMQFLGETPKQFDRILTIVDSYSFETQPEYYKIYNILEEVREEKGIRINERWDWEGKSSLSTTSTITSYSERELKAKKER